MKNPQKRNTSLEFASLEMGLLFIPPLVGVALLAARIDEAVCKLYGTQETKRIRQALHDMDQNKQTEIVLDPTNELMTQRANSYVHGLTATPFHPAKNYKWIKKIESKWQTVRKELLAALENPEELYARGTNVWAATAPGEYGPSWRTLPLCDRTVWDPVNSAIFPKTCELLHSAKVPLIEAFFASMGPQSDIKPHSDMCNFALTCHLGLDVPEGECAITVGDTRRDWKNGEAIMFDTSILHEAENLSRRTRYILMMRVYHPELTAVERRSLQLIFDCLDEPEILDDASSLQEYEKRRRDIEAASRAPWEQSAGRRP